ncbi:DNA-binding protein [Neptunomonas marina]|uniref:DNA-binding protein n=1 Tax=Neptunomonas marina TaxID=1815562 RepID=A0A437QE60_9GAMM|nr:DNA-binding protein [Neptunomonas marina]RVU32810.1 DNA-binding protein [Neptunomonas marina]
MKKQQIFDCADSILRSGELPSVESVAKRCGMETDEVVIDFAAWQSALPTRVRMSDQDDGMSPGVPEVITVAVSHIWQQAVDEARHHFERSEREVGVHEEESRRISDDTLNEVQQRRQELENRLREQGARLDELTTQNKALEAEVSVLKAGIASETTMLKQEEQIRSNLEHELNHLRKTHEDTKRTFDQRIKDEQRHTLEAVSKAEVDVRYYKNALEKLRDEVGKKESALTKDIHDLKGEIAKRDVKLETQVTQLRSQEDELKQFKHDAGNQSRELAKVNASLLSETNKTKRLQDRIQELETEIKRLNQKYLHATSDWSRRENVIRNSLKDKDDELIRAQARASSLEKRIIGQDEEIRRLNAKI